MKNIKYTTDGKKVRVIGSLNSQEQIVQEIFIQKDGSEIPSGENFVVKSLHDKPVLSWKERINARYEAEKTLIENKIKGLNESYKREEKTLRAFMKEFKAMQSIKPEQFEMLDMFLCNRIKYVLLTDSYNFGISEFGKVAIDEYERTIEGVNLVTLYGKSNGDLAYRINRYRDGSGDWKEFIPFDSLESAREGARNHLRNLFTEKGIGGIGSNMIAVIKEHDLDMDDILTAFNASRTEIIKRQIADKKQNHKKEIALLKAKLSEKH